VDITVVILAISLFLSFAVAVGTAFRFLIRNAADNAGRESSQRNALVANTEATKSLTIAFEAFEEKTGTRLSEAEMKIAVMQQALWPDHSPYRKNDGGPDKP
jgi:flagellar basal body-associated protein FliL